MPFFGYICIDQKVLSLWKSKGDSTISTSTSPTSTAAWPFTARHWGCTRSNARRPPTAYLGDDRTGFRLELTWLRDHAGRAYELGENESHLCLRVEGDYDAVREYHRSRGWVCYENHDMGLYFINDPDDYWIEVLPVK